MLCRLKLKALNTGKVISNIGSNRCGDEGAFLVARHLSYLEELVAYGNKLGCEGVAAITSNLTKLVALDIDNNEEAGHGVTPLGKLPILKELWARTYAFMQIASNWETGL